ncbi:MAG: UDP-N-acetylglucosamine 4,6-dehydratase (inverting) [Planctomycetes bacterium]|nr:UDP-N-acetylglucosamine 4,6-dehydratase (inverting) [Planctomycetota bacterium]
MLNDKTILVTGGTGSFGHEFIKKVLEDYKPKKVIVFSRDEFKQYQMQKRFSKWAKQMRYLLGDIRDEARLQRAFEGVDYVIHAAALKQVPALEYNPMEAVKTNVIGAENIVSAALSQGVKKVITLSTDKAVNPVNLYGATKLVAEKVFIAANASGGGRTRFSAVRYGNVMGSRGSVIPLFVKFKNDGVTEFPITDDKMTRFWITLEQAVELVMIAIKETEGGEVFVPDIPSMKVTDLAKAILPKCTFNITGIRPGEKLHESLISSDESRSTKKVDGVYVVIPQFKVSDKTHDKYEKYDAVPEGFVFSSNLNKKWLSQEELREMIGGMKFD